MQNWAKCYTSCEGDSAAVGVPTYKICTPTPVFQHGHTLHLFVNFRYISVVRMRNKEIRNQDLTVLTFCGIWNIQEHSC